ncbi:MAG TPA: ATP-binding protein [Galbitalea sp.]|nr:ATP-binding protein [Galbitalea sp.]
MALGSFANGALLELVPEDLDRMLQLDETLYVEHKRGIGKDEAFQIVKAVASFANTAGGWLLIWVHKSAVVPIDAADALRNQLDGAPSLVDAIRDRLRGRIDPLPTFEAKVIQHDDGPVGVVRVYESSDTPHVTVLDGAVYVREVAGVRDSTTPKQSGAGRLAQRAFHAAAIGSRAELVELSDRGRRATERVTNLLNTPFTVPLVERALGLRFVTGSAGGLSPELDGRGRVIVRIAPYTLSPRFRGWATTHDGAAAVIKSAEDLADFHGLAPGWATPDPAGAATIEVPFSSPPHSDGFHTFRAFAHVMIDGCGIAGAAVALEPPSPDVLLTRLSVTDLAEKVICPTVKAADHVLSTGEFIGRARCQVDLVGLRDAIFVEHQLDQEAPAPWVPITIDVTIPATERELGAVALRAAYAYARSAGLPFWDMTPSASA